MGKIFRVVMVVAVFYLAFLAFHLAPLSEDARNFRARTKHPHHSFEARLENFSLALHSASQVQLLPSIEPTEAQRPPRRVASPEPIATTNSTVLAPALALKELGNDRGSDRARLGVLLRSRPRMTCNSTKGPFVVVLDPILCPRSVRQIVTMLQAGFFSQGLSFWRVNEWITQFGADESPAARQKRGATDPYSHVRKGLGNDLHPACQAAGHTTVRACKDASNTAETAPEKGSSSNVVLETMTGPTLVAARKAGAWRRGTLAVIGGTHFVVVRGANTDMGTAAHDCPAGEVIEEENRKDAQEKAQKEDTAVALNNGMTRVFDRLYSGYGNFIDNRGALKKTGPDQRDIFRSGLSYMTTKYPLLDTLLDCSMSDEDADYVINTTAAFAAPQSGS